MTTKLEELLGEDAHSYSIISPVGEVENEYNYENEDGLFDIDILIDIMS